MIDYKEEKLLVPGRTRTSAVNLSLFKVLAWWDFLSYPESYPSQSRAAMGPLGIGWARMSRHRDHTLPGPHETARHPSGEFRDQREIEGLVVCVLTPPACAVWGSAFGISSRFSARGRLASASALTGAQAQRHLGRTGYP